MIFKIQKVYFLSNRFSKKFYVFVSWAEVTHFSLPSTSDTSSPTVSWTSFSSELRGEVRFEITFSKRKFTVHRAPSVPGWF